MCALSRFFVLFCVCSVCFCWEQPITSRLLMQAVQTQGQAPRQPRGGGQVYSGAQVYSEKVSQDGVGMRSDAQDGVGMRSDVQVGVGMRSDVQVGVGMRSDVQVGVGMRSDMQVGLGMRSDAIFEETKKHLLHRQQQELQERKAEMQRIGTQAQVAPPRGGSTVGGFGNLAGGDLRNLLSKGRGGAAPRPAGFGGGISSRLGPIGTAVAVEAREEVDEQEEKVEKDAEDAETEAPAEEEGDGEADVAFNVTMPAAALAAPAEEEEEMQEGEEGWEEGWEEGDASGGYYAGYRGRGRGRGRGAFRGRGGTFVPGVRGRGGFKARGGIRGRGRGGGPVETYAAKKWVNPALVAAAAGADGTPAPAFNGATAAAPAAATGAGEAAAGATGADGSKVYRKEALQNAPVVGKLNLDGDLSGVGKRGLYKSAKWVKAS
jgi:hypothetical protein